MSLSTWDWPAVTVDLDAEGCAVTPRLLTAAQCRDLAALYDRPELFRSTIDMARHRFGSGQYRYFTHDLPEPVRALREGLQRCHQGGQSKSAQILLHYQPEDWNALPRDPGLVRRPGPPRRQHRPLRPPPHPGARLPRRLAAGSLALGEQRVGLAQPFQAAGTLRADAADRDVQPRADVRVRVRRVSQQHGQQQPTAVREPGQRLVTRVAHGGTVLDPEVVRQLLTASRRGETLAALTPREREVLSLIAQGRSNAAITAALFITPKVVEKHVANIFDKLGLAAEFPVMRQVPDHAAAGITRAIPRHGQTTPARVRTPRENPRHARSS
jgi:hypothetical protein